MNQFYKVTKLLKDRLQSNELVNTVIFARTEDKDLFKKKLYPLAHIHPLSSPYINSQEKQYSFVIGVFEQRDINKETETTVFEGNDDVIDNLNVCDAILNDLISYLELVNNEFEIELVNVSNMQPLLLNDTNLLDGMAVEITLSIPNTTISVC